MTIAELRELQSKKLVNLRQLALKSGIKYHTLLRKLKRGSELKITESEAIEKALEEVRR